MLNAQPIGGKKGSRWRDDIWTLKYLPKFKWNMLTEQVGECYAYSSFLCDFERFIAHEAALHAAKLRVEISQSRSEQKDYLKNVELARVLTKRAEKKREKGESFELKPNYQPGKRKHEEEERTSKKAKVDKNLDNVLGSIF